MRYLFTRGFHSYCLICRTKAILCDGTEPASLGARLGMHIVFISYVAYCDSSSSLAQNPSIVQPTAYGVSPYLSCAVPPHFMRKRHKFDCESTTSRTATCSTVLEKLSDLKTVAWQWSCVAVVKTDTEPNRA
jgi:hypothetical protein